MCVFSKVNEDTYIKETQKTAVRTAGFYIGPSVVTSQNKRVMWSFEKILSRSVRKNISQSFQKKKTEKIYVKQDIH